MTGFTYFNRIPVNEMNIDGCVVRMLATSALGASVMRKSSVTTH